MHIPGVKLRPKSR